MVLSARGISSLVRIMLLRGSPERILYSRTEFIVGLALAVVVSGLVQMVFHGDHVIFAILRVFAELTVFMLWMVLLTARVARLRLASLMLVLVWMSVLVDVCLLPLAWLSQPDLRLALALLVGGALAYGASSAVAWALHRKFARGGVHVIGYIGGVLAIDLAFRHLYGIVAA